MVAIERCTVVLNVPDKLFGAGALSEFCVIHKRDRCSLAGEPSDACVTQVRLLNVPKLTVNRVQGLDEVRFGGRLMKFLITCRVDGSVLSRVKLRVELFHVLLCKL